MLKPDEVLIRVRATTVSSGDTRVRALRLPRGLGPFGRLFLGFLGPRQPILGTEVSGLVAAVGGRVSSFRAGDPVVAFLDAKMGGHAQYAAIKETGLIVGKPANQSFEAAASLCFGGMTARDYIRKAALKTGEMLLVIGASGAVGSAFVQLARQMGVHVTAVTSTANVERVRALGANIIIDYTKENFSNVGQSWDVIADTVAASSFRHCLPVLREGGRYLSIAGDLADMLTGNRGSKRSISGPAKSRLEDLLELRRFAESGDYKPLIDSVYDFEEMREAHTRTDTGRKRGSVVVRIADD
ncbi:MAG: NAD(P)-dependent alcohol dehydrogenase [Beijerinckiaceae bacterium]|nr:NAD(P)-dependent alcohol dehydrogenase [Beijerinckiaceae bacterium]